MHSHKLFLVIFLQLAFTSPIYAQSGHLQQGLIFKAGTNLRLSGARIVDKQTLAKAQSNLYRSFWGKLYYKIISEFPSK
ncbi:MAG TPA: hypothetical protein VL442_19035 [Mucilaginibacter sp.]|jgi:hypothetical protein|nr:hypothetical protein [Mucilaginibacter sp.]